MSKNVGDENRASGSEAVERYESPAGDFCELMLVGIADHLRDTWHCGDLLGGSLSIATGHHNLAVGIFTVNAADDGARVLIGGGGYRAGVENHDLRLR
jgi:hypothetical protein